MKIAAVAALSAVLSTGMASAKTDVTTVGVSATAVADCVVRSEKQLNFGVYGQENRKGKPLLHRNRVLLIACTKGTRGVEISLNGGSHYAHGRRRMREAHGKGMVDYQVYTSGRRNEVWDVKNPVAYVPKTDELTSIQAFGKVPGGQRPPSGEYSDTLTATVNF